MPLYYVIDNLIKYIFIYYNIFIIFHKIFYKYYLKKFKYHFYIILINYD